MEWNGRSRPPVSMHGLAVWIWLLLCSDRKLELGSTGKKCQTDTDEWQQAAREEKEAFATTTPRERDWNNR